MFMTLPTDVDKQWPILVCAIILLALFRPPLMLPLNTLLRGSDRDCVSPIWQWHARRWLASALWAACLWKSLLGECQMSRHHFWYSTDMWSNTLDPGNQQYPSLEWKHGWHQHQLRDPHGRTQNQPPLHEMFLSEEYWMTLHPYVWLAYLHTQIPRPLISYSSEGDICWHHLDFKWSDQVRSTGAFKSVLISLFITQ